MQYCIKPHTCTYTIAFQLLNGMWKRDMKLFKSATQRIDECGKRIWLKLCCAISFYFVWLWLCCFVFGWFRLGPLEEKLLLNYSNILHTTAESINFQRHYILSAVHHSDMRQTNVNKQRKRATTKTLSIISIWSFVLLSHLALSFGATTHLHGYNNTKNVFDFMHG